MHKIILACALFLTMAVLRTASAQVPTYLPLIPGCTGPLVANGGNVLTCPGTLAPQYLAPGTAAANLGFTPLAHVSNLSALSSYNTTLSNHVHRDGYATAGDGGSADYTYSSSPCSLNSGAGDTGYQVQASGGGCWTADAPRGELDIRVWGAKTDGTDAGPAINNAIADFPGCPIVPATAAGFFINTTINNTNCLKGVAFQPTNQAPNMIFSGTSFLTCSRTVNPCGKVSVATGPNITQGPQWDNMEIVGAAGTPNAGVVGLQFAGGFGDNTRNLLVANFDSCVKWGPNSSPGNGGISSMNYGLDVAMCKTHFFVVDGWPEVHVFGGRAGFDGSGDYSASNDFVYITKSLNQGSGGGPNTINFDNYHFNPTGGVGCAVYFGGWAGTGGVQAEYHFTNDHFEWHSYAGAGKQGVICSDNTVPGIEQLWMENGVVGGGGLTMDMFNLDPVTYIGQAWFDNNTFGVTSTTLAPGAAPNTGSGIVYFNHNVLGGNVSLTANTNLTVHMNGNGMSGLTIAGNWNFLSSENDQYSSLTDNATGHISWSSPNSVAWTPTLVGTGGGPITQAGNVGFYTRTANGGYKVFYNILPTALNGATGTLTITGFPKTCLGGPGSQPPTTISGVTVTGAVTASLVGSTINLYQSANSGGAAVMTASEITPLPSNIAGVIECLAAQ